MTSLLREIQENAASDAVSVRSLLRKCQILAGRLQNEAFAAWVRNELSGYSTDADLPAYRGRHKGRLIGSVVNLAYRHTDASLPETSIPDQFRDDFMFTELRQPVAELEELAKANRDPARPIPSEMWPLMEQHYGGGYQIIEARVYFPRTAVVAALDAVRSKALEFAIEIERLNPQAGEASPAGAPPIAPDAVERVVTNVYADSVNFAQGSSNFTQVIASPVVPGDWEALVNALKTAGVTDDELADLRTAIEADNEATEQPGPETSGWLGRVTMRLSRPSTQFGIAVSAEIVGRAIAGYLGLA